MNYKLHFRARDIHRICSFHRAFLFSDALLLVEMLVFGLLSAA